MTFVSTSAKGAGGGTSNLVTLFDTTLGADAASIDLTPIPGTYAHLWIVGQFRSTVAATGDFLLVKVNNDGGANYYDEQLDGNATTASAAQDIAQTRGFTFGLMGDTGPTAAFTTFEAHCPSYTAARTKTFVTAQGEVRSLASNFHYAATMGMWNSTAAITRLTFLPLTGPNLKAGSRVTVYGLGVA